MRWAVRVVRHLSIGGGFAHARPFDPPLHRPPVISAGSGVEAFISGAV